MQNIHLIITLLTLVCTIVLLVGNFLRYDLIAALIVVVLMVSGVLDIPQALAGFSSHAVIIIACMFIIGEAIIYTGIARNVGAQIIRYGGTSETRLLCMIMIAACVVGAFMSSTATAAIFIPITLAVADNANVNHKRLLMPLAAASLISGMMTLVATTPNIVINNMLREQGHETFAFFSFTPFGVFVLALAIIFMILFGQDLLATRETKPQRSSEPFIDDLLQYYKIDKNEFLLRIPEGSGLIGRSVSRLQLGAHYHVNLLAVQTLREGKKIVIPARPEMVFQAGDIIMILGELENTAAFVETFGLKAYLPRNLESKRKMFFQVVGVAEVMLRPDSDLIGKNLKELHFQSLHHLLVLGIRRKGVTITDDISDQPLKYGDVLLVCGSWMELKRLRKNRRQYMLLTMPEDSKDVVAAPGRQKTALTILAVMVALMALDILQPVSAILAATVLMVLSGCVPQSSIYKVIDWPTLVLIAGILPLATALQETKAISYAAEAFLAVFAHAGPLPVLLGLFMFTAILGLFMNSTAVAVLVGPMAVDIALKLNISPQGCAMAVAVACSAAFVSPLGSTVNMLVREPGGYRMVDFAKVGIPLLLLTMFATVLLIWLIYL